MNNNLYQRRIHQMYQANISRCLFFTCFLTLTIAKLTSAADCWQYGGRLYVWVHEETEITWIEENYYDSRGTDVWAFKDDGYGWKYWERVGTYYGIRSVFVYGSDEDDIITCHLLNQGSYCYMWGFGGNDSLYGSNGHDYLMGGDGDDYLDGKHGIDSLWGDDGQDELLGNWGRDKLYGGRGNDYLDGGNDGYDDKLFGGPGQDKFINYLDYEFWWHDQDTPEDYEHGWDWLVEIRNYK